MSDPPPPLPPTTDPTSAASVAAGQQNGVAPASTPPTPDICSATITMTNGVSFVDWFNATMFNNKNYMAPGPSSQAMVKTGDLLFQNKIRAPGFNDMWNNIPLLFGNGTTSVPMNSFVTMFCIPYNETGGSFRPVREAFFVALKSYHLSDAGWVGTPKTPPNFDQDRYLFRYNQNVSSMRLAGDQLLARQIISSPADKAAWNSRSYPTNASVDVKTAARECDFFKYSGLGLIQLTWRSNYLACADQYIKAFKAQYYSVTGDPSCVNADGSPKGCDDLTAAELLEAFQEPTVYIPSVFGFNSKPGVSGAFSAACQGTNFDGYGYRVAGSVNYGSNVYGPRCRALQAEMKKLGYSVTPNAAPSQPSGQHTFQNVNGQPTLPAASGSSSSGGG